MGKENRNKYKLDFTSCLFRILEKVNTILTYITEQ